MYKFDYSSSGTTIFYKGNIFDSLLELKFALHIESTHAWLREGLELYYGLHGLANGVKGKLHCYRPDFLIRNWQTGEASLVEIKPDGFNDSSLVKRAKIANRHARQFCYDWNFTIVYESEIHLSEAQWHEFKKIQTEQTGWIHKPCLQILQNTSDLSDSEYRAYVLTGVLPATVH
jgi:hypothetical protein